jgi:hypothetical protein
MVRRAYLAISEPVALGVQLERAKDQLEEATSDPQAALALLAIGEHDIPRRLAKSLDDPLLRARYLAWTGDASLGGDVTQARFGEHGSGEDAAGAILSMVEYRLGIVPDAAAQRLTIAPDALETIAVRQLRCGKGLFDFRLTHSGRTLRCRFQQTRGPRFWVTFAPRLATRPVRAMIDGNIVQPAGSTLEFESASEVDISYDV